MLRQLQIQVKIHQARSDSIRGAESDGFHAVVMQSLEEIVDGHIGVRTNEDREWYLPMELEELDRFDDDACLSLSLVSSVSPLGNEEVLTVPGGLDPGHQHGSHSSKPDLRLGPSSTSRPTSLQSPSFDSD
jgi:hypothetical protein